MDMKHSAISFLAVMLSLVMAADLYAGNDGNIAYVDDNVRFTVVTDGVIRMEWHPDGKFVDLPSLVASERDYPHADFEVRKRGRNIEVATSRMVLTYRTGSGKFSADNLVVRAADGFFTWTPGMSQKENLKGTFRTLDGLEGDLQTQSWVRDMKQGEHRRFEDGIIAKDGWTLIDDSESLLFDDSDWAWVKEREPGECQDWYFMAYGHDYKAALKDYTVFAGRMPLPPRFAFGYWWSRYWNYSDRELRNLVHKFRMYGIPLDVIVLDMDWHYTDPGRGGWTGWTWNESLFPNPRKFMEYLDEENINVTLNLHPADGIKAYEKCYPRLASALGREPADSSDIEWINSDKKFMTEVFSRVLRPMQEEGVDFWWLDWQQHIYDTRLPKLNNTFWVNYCFFSDMERNGDKRPLLYYRWGGLGNHRYQIGFSGDAVISWKSLEFQPFFTATASNVLYGYWSHDIGGHLGSSIDPEMYVRWLQYGGFSPVMRTHSSKNPGLNKEPWVFAPEYSEIIRRTVRRRYIMAPYIYTMARKGYDDGISLCRPMYYDWPEAPEAYRFRSQYMFGDNVLVAPITSASVDGFSCVEVWLPEGDWYEADTGTLLHGGRVLKRHFALDEYGVYVKAGSILPFYGSEVDSLAGNDEDVTVTVFPGGEGSFLMYEDGGNDKDYPSEYAFTPLSNVRDGSVQTITVGSREGSYKEMPSGRGFKVKVLASEAPLSVTVNGKSVGYEYLDDGLAFMVDVPVKDCSAEKVVRIEYANQSPSMADGVIGMSRRIARSIEAMKFRTGADPIDELALLGSVNETVLYSCTDARAVVETFLERYGRLPEILSVQPRISPEDAEWFLRHCGWYHAMSGNR